MQSFYLADEQHKSVKGDVIELKGLLYFKQDKSGFDGKANKEHVKNYPGEFEAFKKANPKFVLPDSFVDVEIGAPLAKAQAPEKEAPHDDKVGKKH